MGDTVTIKFVNNKKEYCEAIRAFYSRSKRTKIDIIIALGVMLFGIGCWAIYGFSWVWTLALAVGVLGIVIRFIAFYVMPSIRFDQEPKFKDEYILSFNDEGLHFHTEHLDSKLDWNYYYKALETDKFYMLLYGKSLFTIVPKRAFDGDEHERDFKSIISKNLREGIESV